MDYNLIKDQFGTWAPVLKDFIEKDAFNDIFKTLRGLTKRGRTVCPTYDKTFRCFTETPYDQLRAVFVFSCPYETMVNNRPLADGLALSTGNTGTVTPGIKHFFNAMAEDFPNEMPDRFTAPDLSYLASQGVLMLNVALTTELYKYGSHVELWRPFMEYLFTEVLGRYPRSLPIVFVGEQAKSFNHLVFAFNHWVFTAEDPVKLDADQHWEHKNLFRHVDRIIRDNNPGFFLKWNPARLAA
jgi:uracil DNA glycosylase